MINQELLKTMAQTASSVGGAIAPTALGSLAAFGIAKTLNDRRKTRLDAESEKIGVMEDPLAGFGPGRLLDFISGKKRDTADKARFDLQEKAQKQLGITSGTAALLTQSARRVYQVSGELGLKARSVDLLREILGQIVMLSGHMGMDGITKSWRDVYAKSEGFAKSLALNIASAPSAFLQLPGINELKNLIGMGLKIFKGAALGIPSLLGSIRNIFSTVKAKTFDFFSAGLRSAGKDQDKILKAAGFEQYTGDKKYENIGFKALATVIPTTLSLSLTELRKISVLSNMTVEQLEMISGVARSEAQQSNLQKLDQSKAGHFDFIKGVMSTDENWIGDTLKKGRKLIKQDAGILSRIATAATFRDDDTMVHGNKDIRREIKKIEEEYGPAGTREQKRHYRNLAKDRLEKRSGTMQFETLDISREDDRSILGRDVRGVGDKRRSIGEGIGTAILGLEWLRKRRAKDLENEQSQKQKQADDYFDSPDLTPSSSGQRPKKIPAIIPQEQVLVRLRSIGNINPAQALMIHQNKHILDAIIQEGQKSRRSLKTIAISLSGIPGELVKNENRHLEYIEHLNNLSSIKENTDGIIKALQELSQEPSNNILSKLSGFADDLLDPQAASNYYEGTKNKPIKPGKVAIVGDRPGMSTGELILPGTKTTVVSNREIMDVLEGTEETNIFTTKILSNNIPEHLKVSQDIKKTTDEQTNILETVNKNIQTLTDIDIIREARETDLAWMKDRKVEKTEGKTGGILGGIIPMIFSVLFGGAGLAKVGGGLLGGGLLKTVFSLISKTVFSIFSPKNIMRGFKLASKVGLKAVGIGLIIDAVLGVKDAVFNAEEISGNENVGFFGRIGVGMASMLSNLTFGLLPAKTVYGWFSSIGDSASEIGSSIGNYFSNAWSGITEWWSNFKIEEVPIIGPLFSTYGYLRDLINDAKEKVDEEAGFFPLLTQMWDGFSFKEFIESVPLIGGLVRSYDYITNLINDAKEKDPEKNFIEIAWDYLSNISIDDVLMKLPFGQHMVRLKDWFSGSDGKSDTTNQTSSSNPSTNPSTNPAAQTKKESGNDVWWLSQGSQGSQGEEGKSERSFFDKLLGRNKTTASEPSVGNMDHMKSFTADDEAIIARIKEKEGFSAKPYWDVDAHSIGYGHKITPGNEYLMNGVTKEQADKMLREKYPGYKSAAMGIPGFDKMNAQGQAALIDMTYNMGKHWYKRWPTNKEEYFIRSLMDGRYGDASKALLNTKYAKQVGNRARENAAMIAASGSPGTSTASASSTNTSISSGINVDNLTQSTASTSPTQTIQEINTAQASTASTTSTSPTPPTQTTQDKVEQLKSLLTQYREKLDSGNLSSSEQRKYRNLYEMRANQLRSIGVDVPIYQRQSSLSPSDVQQAHQQAQSKHTPKQTPNTSSQLDDLNRQAQQERDSQYSDTSSNQTDFSTEPVQSKQPQPVVVVNNQQNQQKDKTEDSNSLYIPFVTNMLSTFMNIDDEFLKYKSLNFTGYRQSSVGMVGALA